MSRMWAEANRASRRQGRLWIGILATQRFAEYLIGVVAVCGVALLDPHLAVHAPPISWLDYVGLILAAGFEVAIFFSAFLYLPIATGAQLALRRFAWLPDRVLWSLPGLIFGGLGLAVVWGLAGQVTRVEVIGALLAAALIVVTNISIASKLPPEWTDRPQP